jgi:hypothetical protein
VATLSEKLQYIISVDANSAIRTFQTVGKSAEKELGKAQTNMDRLGAKFTQFGVGALAASTVAGVGMVKLGRGAADLNETVMKTGVIFGDSTAEIIAFGDAAAKSLGLSKRAALDASARFATFGKVVGKSGTELVEYSEALTKRAVDLASFWNTDLESAFTAISSGLQGEALPLRKYGILLDDLTLRQRALSMEIYDGIGPLTAQQRVAAASAEIMAQNTDSIGDYARTQANLPNQIKRFNAELQNTKDALGAAVLPAMKSVVTTTGDVLSAFNSLGPGVQNTIGTIAGFGVAALGVAGVASTVIGQVIKMRDTFTTLGPAAKGAATGVAALASALVAAQALDAATGSGAFADLTAEVEELVVALGDGETSIIGIITATENLVNEISNKKGVLNKAFDVGDVLATGATRAEKWNEMLTQAFESVRSQSPVVAQKFVDSLRQMDEAAKNGSSSASEFMDNYDLSTSDIDEMQAVLDRTAAATEVLTAEVTDAGDAALDSSQKFTELKGSLDVAKAGFQAYYDALSNEQAFIDLARSLGEMQARLEDSSVSAAEQAADLNAAKRAVIDYADEVGGIPTSTITKILTILDQGDYREAADALARLAAPRTAQLNIQASLSIGGQRTGADLRNAMEGRTAGETAGKAAADAFTAGFSKGSSSSSTSSETPKTAEQIMADWDRVFANLYKMGEWDLARYRSMLQLRLGQYQKYSDDYMRVWSELRSLDEQEQALKDSAAQAERERLADAAQAEQDRVDNAHTLGELSDAEYIASLQNRMAAYDRYSNEYVAIWKTIQQLRQKEFDQQEALAKAEQDRRDDAERERQREIEAERNKLAANRGDALGILTINITNTSADPQSVVRAIEQARRLYGSRWLTN